jgi:hypothetical protein
MLHAVTTKGQSAYLLGRMKIKNPIRAVKQKPSGLNDSDLCFSIPLDNEASRQQA